MDDPKYDQDYEYYDDNEDYRRRGLTGVGLPPGQLALVIGVNAVISLIISVGVVLIAGRQALPGDVFSSPAGASALTTKTVAVGGTPNQTITPTGQVAPENAPALPQSYIVQPGDTLGGIADKYGVPLANLMSANGLTNQDFIQVGQTLTIPVKGVFTPTPTFTSMPIPTDTPLPFDPPTPLPTDVEIPPEPAATVGPSPTPTRTSTPISSPTLHLPTPTILPTFTPPPFDQIKVVISEVIGAGDLFQETLVILNQGAGTSLKGWKLEGSPLGVMTFPDIFLFSGGSIRIHTVAGESTASDLFLNQGEAAWPSGTTIILSNASNAEIFRYTVPSAP